MSPRLLILIALAGLLGGAYVWMERDTGGDLAAPMRAAQSAPADEGETLRLLDVSNLPNGNPFEGLKLAALKITRDRPLFSESRRPPPKPVEPPKPEPVRVETQPVASPPPVETGVYQLTGVVFQGEESVILLRDTRSGARLRVHQGDEVDGWRVTAENSRSALLVKQGVEERLTLFAPPEEEASQ